MKSLLLVLSLFCMPSLALNAKLSPAVVNRLPIVIVAGIFASGLAGAYDAMHKNNLDDKDIDILLTPEQILNMPEKKEKESDK